MCLCDTQIPKKAKSARFHWSASRSKSFRNIWDNQFPQNKKKIKFLYCTWFTILLCVSALTRKQIIKNVYSTCMKTFGVYETHKLIWNFKIRERKKENLHLKYRYSRLYMLANKFSQYFKIICPVSGQDQCIRTLFTDLREFP